MNKSGSVLVTGGAGYIGSHVALALLSAGWRVVVLDDLSTGRRRPLHDACVMVTGSIGDRILVRRVLAEQDVCAVIHMAASVVAPDSVRRPHAFYDNNTAATLELLRACATHGLAGFLFSSTAAVYGAPEHSPVREDSPAVPINPYGASKLMVERMLRDTDIATDLPHAILRYFNVAGADPDRRCGQPLSGPTHLIKIACEHVLGLRADIPIFGTDYPSRDGTCIRDFIHVSDLAAAHVATLEHLIANGRNLLMNCGYGHGFSVREVLAAVERVAGKPLVIQAQPRRAGDAMEVVADNSRLRNELGWRPEHADIDQMVGDALAWMRLEVAARAER